MLVHPYSFVYIGGNLVIWLTQGRSSSSWHFYSVDKPKKDSLKYVLVAEFLMPSSNTKLPFWGCWEKREREWRKLDVTNMDRIFKKGEKLSLDYLHNDVQWFWSPTWFFSYCKFETISPGLSWKLVFRTCIQGKRLIFVSHLQLSSYWLSG